MSSSDAVTAAFLAAMERTVGPDEPLLLACSGGMDSVVLAHLLHRHQYNFAVAHCNFQLRGEASDGDERFVAEMVTRMKVSFHTRAFPTKALQRSGESLQMAARRIRYDYFQELLDEYNYQYLLTAHHLDDGLETLLINLGRGTGIAGLRGVVSSGKLLRPLRMVSRQDLATYAREHQILWREDASNQKDVYLRNQVRHHVIPVMKEVMPRLESSLPGTLKKIQVQFSLLERGLQLLWEQAARRDGDRWTVTLGQLPDKPEERLYLLEHFLDFAGLDRAQWMKGLAAENRTTLVSATHQAYFAEGRLELTPLPDPAPELHLEWEDLPYEFALGEDTWRMEVIPPPAVFEKTNDVHYLRLAPEDFPLHLRSRQTGDHFQPFGMRGQRQSLKDFITNHKLSQQARNELRVLTTQHGEIAAVIGFRIADNFAVTDGDQQILRLSRRQKNSPTRR
ncbi:tRNA lysidine(34) synthetase TilS [Lewinella sp. W8]|uniref:tRNA lysidine(34) synthetase TilS n=1 Tax=Lewinella sp. W8 TaxID=2528208 RepID=UPI001067FC79|nr:tRNA lysidine(34) synthetase TilS [Lewinella sp. W8]MTB50465.1 tRNA lysidine(34) synthetase TilS [Lewinella sp. W8]